MRLIADILTDTVVDAFMGKGDALVGSAATSINGCGRIRTPLNEAVEHTPQPHNKKRETAPPPKPPDPPCAPHAAAA